MIETNVKKEQQQLHSLLPLTLPSTNNPVDCLYERKGGRRPDEGLKETVRCNSDEMLKQVQHDGKGLAKDAQSQCPPLETLPNINNPVDCLCERKPEFSIPRRGSERSELLTPHQGRPACTTNLETAKEVRSTIIHDIPHHSATEPKKCKGLNVLTSYHLNVFKRHAAFTLAEVLITLAVIGIVAALTLPGLIQNHNEKAWSTAKDLWEKKLTETVRRMNTDGVMTGHNTTEDFMDTFKQYMKVIKTCDHTDINKCYSPKVVTTGSNEEPLEVETDSITSASSMGLSDWQTNTNTMSFVVADGTTVIMAYQSECPYADPIEDTGSQVSCMGYMVDVNGKKGPNRVGKDIQLSSGVAFSTCDNPIGDMCFSTDFAANTAIDTCDGTSEYDKNYTSSVGSGCSTNYWAGARKACKDKGMELPMRAQLAQLASNLYVDSNGDEVTIGATESKSNLKVKDEYKDNPPLTLGYYYWSREEYNALRAYYRYFRTSSTYGGGNYWDRKGYGNYRAICVSN